MKLQVATILYLTFFALSTNAASVDWTRLELEMDYLKSEVEESSNEVAKNSIVKAEDKKALKLRRLPPAEQKGILDLDPMFDSISTTQASPNKEEDESIDEAIEKIKTKKQKTPIKPVNGVISKDQFEQLID